MAELNINQIILSYESTLCIDYTDRDVNTIIENSVKRLENNYGIRIDKPLKDLAVEQGLVSENATTLINQIEKSSADLSYYIFCAMFNKRIPFSLAEVNYLGYDAEKLRVSLKYLQDKKLYNKRNEIIVAFRSALNNLETCIIKRLFIVMLVIEKLGVEESVAVVANILFLGGL